MQSVQRQFGKYMKRSADESQVSVLLKDFEDADKMLTRLIEASKAWRDAWSSILTYQHRLVNEFEDLYKPIVGAAESYQGHQPAETPQETLARTVRLREEYEELKKDLMEEVNLVDDRMIKPATEARDFLQPMKKTIKKREDRKLDFERYQGRVDTGRKKIKRSDRDNTALAKAESDLERSREEYNSADENLRHYLPQLLTVVFSLLPYLLATQIQTQNTLLAHYYTMLHNYCSEENFPSPPPPMEDVVRKWNNDFKPIQHEIESFALLANGKAVKQPMKLADQRNGNPAAAVNGYRRPSSHSLRAPSSSPGRQLPPPSPNYDAKPKISATSSPSASAMLSPPVTTPGYSDISSPPTTTSDLQPHTGIAFSPAAPKTDYFSRDRQPSSNSITSSISTMSISQKKKPPPPPPRVPSGVHALFVTALYDFGGQGEGDLVFREGDRIKVIKKTESTDDWWQGELRGVRGQFPANYCEK
ncbi:MAG: hypothetical protein Q9160_008846 [Pyrenula sp. 1 TL-2023]